MRTTTDASFSAGQTPNCLDEFLHAIPKGLEFEEFDDFAGDVFDVARTIERDGIIVPEYGSFAFD